MLVSLTFTEISTTIMRDLPSSGPFRRSFQPRSRRPLRLLSMLIGAAAMVACQQPPAPPQTLEGTPVARFLVEPPDRLLDLDSLYRLGETDAFSWRRAGEVEQWTVEPIDDPTTAPMAISAAAFIDATSAGLDVQRPLRLRRPVDLRAADVHRFEVDLDPGMGAASLRLRWRRDDEAAVPERRQLGAAPPPARNADGQRYIFHVARRPGWRGKIRELVLEVRPKPNPSDRSLQPRLRRLIPLKRQLDRSALAAVAGQGVLVDLNHQVREAYLAPPGSSLVRRLDIGADDQLHFAFGSEASVRTPVTFRVTVEAPVDGDAGAEATPRVLWQEGLGKGHAWGRWHEVRLALGDMAGPDRILRLETVVGPSPGDPGDGAPESFDIAQGFPFWGHPEVVRPTAADARLPNVLFISLDTVRADRLSLYGHDRPTSPHLDAWAKDRAVVFEQAVAAAPWTLPSHMTLFSGLDALHHGVNHDVGRTDDGKGRGFELLAETLRQRGYDTAATTGGAYLHPKYGFSRGFSSYRYWNDRARDDGELADGIDRALAFMGEERSRPFFFFLHTYAAHDPYEARHPFFERVAPPGLEAVEGEIALHSPPNEPHLAFQQQIAFELRHGKEKRRLDSADRPLLEAFYDSGLARVDAELARLLEGLEDLGLDDETLVVITSDHGENLLEPNRPVGHLDLYDSNLLVPLVIAWPNGRGAGVRVPQQVRGVDILPTILASLGLPIADAVDGVSLIPLVESAVTATPGDDLVPAEAWSYSASANRGLSLRRADGKLIVGNNAWRPAILPPSEIVAEMRDFYDLHHDRGERTDQWTTSEPPSALAADFWDRLQTHWLDHGKGLRLTVRHDGPGELIGQLQGPMVRPVATKSIDLQCHCLTWEDMGKATFRLPSGQGFTLQFEKVFGTRLEVSGQLLDGERRLGFSHTFDVDRLAEEGFLAWHAEGGWTSNEPWAEDHRAQSFLRMFWLGERQLSEDSPSLSDPELRRQLEALGYL